jgi:uncharacterized membrane protein YhdT
MKDQVPATSRKESTYVLMLALAGIFNLSIPYFISRLGSDALEIWLWTCSGFHLAELGFFGFLLRVQVSSFLWRALSCLSITLLFVVIGWIGVRFTGAMSAQDTLAYLYLTCGFALFFTVLDSVFLQMSNIQFYNRNFPIHASSTASNSNQFNLSFLLGLTLVAALAMASLQWMLNENSPSYRPFQNYAHQPWPILLGMAVVLYLKHLGFFLVGCLGLKSKAAMAICVFGLVALELLRRLECYRYGRSISYLDWEFCWIAGGLIAGQATCAATIRWLGWEIK